MAPRVRRTLGAPFFPPPPTGDQCASERDFRHRGMRGKKWRSARRLHQQTIVVR
jgi:hypothetical protein